MTCRLPVLRLLSLAIAVVALLGLPAANMAKSTAAYVTIEGTHSQLISSVDFSKRGEAGKACCNACIPATIAVRCIVPDPDQSAQKLHLPLPETAEGIAHLPLRKPPRSAA